MGSPALPMGASAVLVMGFLLFLKKTAYGLKLWLEFIRVSSELVLFTVPHVALVVGEVMWTWVLAPPARSAGPKRSEERRVGKEWRSWAASRDQNRKALVGRVWVSVNPLAVPVPVLDTVSTEPMM